MLQRTLVFLLITFFLSHSPLWAEVKELIAYSSLTDGYWQIWTMAPDGSHKQQVTRSLSDKRDPAWMNNGQALVCRTNNGELWTVDLATKEEKQVLTRYTMIRNPHYCDASQEIVFVRFDPRSQGAGFIWKTDLKDSYPEVLTRESILKYQPVFSWQCDKIAFVKADQELKNHHVWLMDADGKNQEQLTKETGLFTLPAFSPDQKSLVLTSNCQDDNYEIYVLDLASRETKRITSDPGLDTHARFSPDGKNIVFVSNRSGSQQIWTMDREGRNLQQLTRGPEECVTPDWGRAGED